MLSADFHPLTNHLGFMHITNPPNVYQIVFRNHKYKTFSKILNWNNKKIEWKSQKSFTW